MLLGVKIIKEAMQSVINKDVKNGTVNKSLIPHQSAFGLPAAPGSKRWSLQDRTSTSAGTKPPDERTSLPVPITPEIIHKNLPKDMNQQS